MLRTILALLMSFVIALHMAAPASAAEEETVQTITILDNTTDSGGGLDRPDGRDDTSQLPAHATTKCHDQCNGFTMWLSQDFLRKSPLPIKSPANNFLPTSVAIVVPPPRPAG